MERDQLADEHDDNSWYWVKKWLLRHTVDPNTCKSLRITTL